MDFKRPWVEIKKKSGLPKEFRLHGLRHHYASSLVSAGVDLFTVSKLLTHVTDRLKRATHDRANGATDMVDTCQDQKRIHRPFFRR